MKRFISIAAMATTLIAGQALAQVHGTAAEAKSLSDKAVAYIKSAGAEKAFAEFSDKNNSTWRNKDLYVFAVTWEGLTSAHGGNAGLVGKSVLELKDNTGRNFMRDMIEQAKNKGPGWVDYQWSNPVTKEVAAKSSYVTPVAGYGGFVGVGIYK